jgi:hypothetical protein
MALEPIGVLDLSIVTGLLVEMIDTYWMTSPLWSTLAPADFFKPSVTGLTPDEARKTGTDAPCQITVSLIHIEPDKYNRNFVCPPPQQPPVPNPPPPRAQTIPFLPLGLDLFYFISAFSPGNATQEQQAMSIILNCFHQNPIVRTNVVFPGSPSQSVPEEFTLTMEIESADSISRLWQAITVPFRLSLIYRVGVVFLTPPVPAPLAKQVSRYSLAVEPTSFPFARNGQVFGTSSSTTFIAPDSPPASPRTVSMNYSPATVTPGQRFFLEGAGLNQGTDYPGPPPNPGTSYRVYLLSPPDYKTEQEVTSSWKVRDVGSPLNAIQTSSRIVLDVPSTLGSPGSLPEPGVYLLEAGSDTASSDLLTNRTNTTPFSLAALVNAPAPPALPLLAPVAGTYTVTGMGFIAGNTQVFLETLPLTYVTTPLSAGEFTVPDIATIKFQRPASLSPGLYSVRVRVNGVESPPALWIQV